MKTKKVTRRELEQRRRPPETRLDRSLANEKLRMLDFPGVAVDLIEAYKLRRTATARRLLRHELQLGLLKNIVAKDRTKRENKAFKTLENSAVIERVLWANGEGLVPLDKAVAAFEAGIKLVNAAKTMKLRVKIRWGQVISGFENSLEELRKSEMRMDANPERRRKIEKTSLFFITRQVDAIVKTALGKKRRYFVGKGFGEINGIGLWAFKDVKR